jgi:hypothetical protein
VTSHATLTLEVAAVVFAWMPLSQPAISNAIASTRDRRKEAQPVLTTKPARTAIIAVTIITSTSEKPPLVFNRKLPRIEVIIMDTN